jgi:hypothetical protein
MDLDALLYHYFGVDDLEAIRADAFATGRERLGIDLGIERDPGRRFALWALMHGLGIAPEPIDTFKNPRERQAAETYARLAARTPDQPTD